MPWSVWQGIHLPIISRFRKEAFIVRCIISTFEWWLPNNRCLTLLFLGCWCKTLLPDCLYNEILFECWISEDLRIHFPFRIFWHKHLKKQAQETQISCACSLHPQTGQTHLQPWQTKGTRSDHTKSDILSENRITLSPFKHTWFFPGHLARCSTWINQCNSTDTPIYTCQWPVYCLLTKHLVETSHL